jgi:brefeldin A-inhibited guanine nucleotide-exchange protein
MKGEMGPELQRAVQGVFARVCETQLGIERETIRSMVGGGKGSGGSGEGEPTSPRFSVFGGRRESKASR